MARAHPGNLGQALRELADGGTVELRPGEARDLFEALAASFQAGSVLPLPAVPPLGPDERSLAMALARLMAGDAEIAVQVTLEATLKLSLRSALQYGAVNSFLGRQIGWPPPVQAPADSGDEETGQRAIGGAGVDEPY